MKLLNCYIQNFGKLQNFKYEFHSGINTIKQDNGFGKTTFASFIKAMFYGLDTQANARLEKSDRKRYIPWQGGIYGGNIEFEINEKRYRIERTFGKKATEDTFKLYNLETNLESKDYTENIGEEIFKINKSAYERSTYIPQGQIQIEMEDSISAKLSNVLESDNDINTSEEALKKISESKKLYKKDRGQGGLIDEKKSKLFELQRKFENSKSDSEILENRRKQLESKINQIKELENIREKEQKLLSQKIEQDRTKAKKQVYDNITNSFNQTMEEYNKLDNYFEKGIPTEDFIKNLESQNHEIEKTKIEMEGYRISETDKEELEYLQNKFKKGNISTEEIDQKIVEYSQIQEIETKIQEEKNLQEEKEKELNTLKTTKKKNIIILVISIILAVAGTIITILNIQKIAGIISFICGIVLFIYCLVCKNKRKKLTSLNKEIEKIKENLQQLSNNKNTLNSQIDEFIKLYSVNKNANPIIDLTNIKTEYSKYRELQNAKISNEMSLQKSALKKENLKREIEANLSNYYDSFNKSYTELIQDLKMNINQFEAVKEQLQNVKIEKEKYEKENDVNLFENIEEINNSEDEIKQKIANYNKEIDKKVDEKNQIKNQIEVLENKIDDNEYIESDISSLKEEIETLEEKYKILKITEELLKQSKETFSSSYLKNMVIGFNRYLSIINSKDIKTAVDTNLNVKIEVNGSQKEIKMFSAGYKDLIYICMRFSLVDTLFNQETPFVVLDDPFVNLDESKTSKALEIMNEFAKKYQVIYFSCNSSRINKDKD